MCLVARERPHRVSSLWKEPFFAVCRPLEQLQFSSRGEVIRALCQERTRRCMGTIQTGFVFGVPCPVRGEACGWYIKPCRLPAVWYATGRNFLVRARFIFKVFGRSFPGPIPSNLVLEERWMVRVLL